MKIQVWTMALVFFWGARALAQPVVSASLIPADLGPGSSTILRYDISNGSGSPVEGLAFGVDFPAGLSVADSFGESDCEGAVLFPVSGATSFDYSAERLGAGSSCFLSVPIRSTVPGTSTIISRDLTSTAGNSGNVNVDLNVDNGRFGTSLSASPSALRFNEKTRLTYTFDNTSNASAVTSISVAQTFPLGVRIADTPALFEDCGMGVGHTINVVAGATSMSLQMNGFNFAGFEVILPGESCSLSFDIEVKNTGPLFLSSEVVSGNQGSSGVAMTVLDVAATERLNRSVRLNPSLASPGSIVTLHYELQNFDRNVEADSVEFSDDLAATLSGVSVLSFSVPEGCGDTASLSGDTMVNLASASVQAEGLCHFDVEIMVPSNAVPNSYVFNHEPVSANFAEVAFVGEAANSTLQLAALPTFGWTVLNAPAVPGEVLNVEVVIENSSVLDALADGQFIINADDWISGLLFEGGAVSNPCGAGSSFSAFLTGSGTSPSETTMEGVGFNLGVGESCTFTLPIIIPESAVADASFLSASSFSFSLGANTFVIPIEPLDIPSVFAPGLRAEFLSSSGAPGENITIEYRLSAGDETGLSVTDLAFTHDFNATLSGLIATGLPQNDVCGPGSILSGTNMLSLSGANFDAGESCVFEVVLQIPVSALPGQFSGATSSMTAQVSGETVTAAPVSVGFLVSGLNLSAEILEPLVFPGGSATLEFTLNNTSPSLDATSIGFSHNLSSVLNGLALDTALPLDVCGGTLNSIGASSFGFSGGAVLAGGQCSFSLSLSTPPSAASLSYPGSTSSLSASIGGGTSVLSAAFYRLNIGSDIRVSKSFAVGAAGGGQTIELQYLFENPNDSALSSIEFVENFDDALLGLVSSSGTLSDVCGMGSIVLGGSVLSFSGGSVAAMGSCSFSIVLSVPSDAALGTLVTSISGDVTGEVDGLSINLGPMQSSFGISGASFSHEFLNPGAIGNTTVVNYLIENVNPDQDLFTLEFEHDIESVLPNSLFVSFPSDGFCGPDSTTSGMNPLVVSIPSLAAGETCSFSAEVSSVPQTEVGNYRSETSTLMAGTIILAESSVSIWTLIPPPAIYTVDFLPAAVETRQTSVLSWRIDNTVGTGAIQNIDLSDSLVEGLWVEDASSAIMSGCAAGSVVFVDDSADFSFEDLSVAEGEICVVSVPVYATEVGAFEYTPEALSSSSGQSEGGAATLVVTLADQDGDGVDDAVDTAPNDPFVCADTDTDLCDDCAQTGADGSGGDPMADGTDYNSDGICDASDPEPVEPSPNEPGEGEPTLGVGGGGCNCASSGSMDLFATLYVGLFFISRRRRRR